jgi:hypothetical protein
MALKRKNIDLSLNLFLTAALLHVLIQSNGWQQQQLVCGGK